MKFLRDLTGSFFAVLGAFIFQIGFWIMTEKMKSAFAEKLVEKFENL